MTKDEFQREERYVVFKLSDIADYFYPSEISQLFRLSRTQQAQRAVNGKLPLECVVVESDWPEYEPTWKAIEARVMGAQPAPSVPDGWKLVPIEPTEDMLRAMTDPFIAINGDNRKAFEIAYTAMLSAAPEAKP